MTESDIYQTIEQQGQGEYTEKKSKFLSFIHHVTTTEECKELVKTYKKKYYDARHVCHAYRLRNDENVGRYSDDGEPSGTAGRPILGQILSHELTDVLIIVVRYFGGVLLGTSGLITAYKEAAELAVNDTQVIVRQVEELFTFSFAYEKMHQVMRVVKELEPEIVERKYEQDCQITFRIRKSMIERLKQRLEQSMFE